MKYEKEIDKVIEESLRDSDMSEIGIKNGHSLQTQLTIISEVLSKLKADDSDFSR